MSERTSMLAGLTAEVMGDKTKAAKKNLTPVAGEGKPAAPTRILPMAPAPFPNDMPQEVIEQKAAELTVIIEHLIASRDALLLLIERPIPAEIIDLDQQRKATEAKADEDFAARQERLREEAQASLDDVLHKDNLDGTTGVTVTDLTEEWTCPDHGAAEEKTSPATGKTYIGCPECVRFKR